MDTAIADLGLRRAFQVNAGEDLYALTPTIQVGGVRQVLDALRLGTSTFRSAR